MLTNGGSDRPHSTPWMRQSSYAVASGERGRNILSSFAAAIVPARRFEEILSSRAVPARSGLLSDCSPRFGFSCFSKESSQLFCNTAADDFFDLMTF